jgi:hypothetical protein
MVATMTTPYKFRASYLKLDRASEHMDELRALVATYIAAEPLGFTWEPVPWLEEFAKIHPRDACLIGLVPRVRIPIPETLAPIIGDVVHNLRSALDIMMFDLISEGVPEDKRRFISFPFWRSESTKAKAMQYVEPNPRIASLVNAWEPYPGGRSRLYALHEMWNADKHRSIIPMMGGVEFSQGQALFGHSLNGEPLIDPFPVRKQVRDGRPYIVQQQGDNAPPLGAQIPCVVRLALDGDAEIKGRDLIQELDAHCKVVRYVLESIETGVAPTYAPPPSPRPVSIGPGQWMFPPTMTPEDVDKWLSENERSLV